MTHDVFISHSSQDRAIGDAACAALEKCGRKCWIAPRDIMPGDDYGEAIVDGIRDSRVFLLVVSAASVASPQVRRETERAANAGIPIIPFRIEDVLPSKSLEFFISSAHWLDAISRPMDPHYDYLCKVVDRLLAEADGSTVPPMPMRAMVAPGAPVGAAAAPSADGGRFSPKQIIATLAIAGGLGVAGLAIWTNDRGDSGAKNSVIEAPRSIFTRRAIGTDGSKPVRLRANPSFDAETITLVPPDQIFRVAPRQGDWWPAQLANGNQGYVHAAWINVIDPDGNSRPAQPLTPEELAAGNAAAAANEAAPAPSPPTANSQ